MLFRSGDTALLIAMRYPIFDNIMCLVELGADVNCVDIHGFTPLMYAVRYGDLKLVKYLVYEGADVNNYNSEQEEDVDILLNSLSDRTNIYHINHKSELYISTPLHIAISRGDFDIIEYLVDKFANVNNRNKDKATPLYMACHEGDLSLVIFLIKNGADVKIGRAHV